jgi:hypothetical protein
MTHPELLIRAHNGILHTFKNLKFLSLYLNLNKFFSVGDCFDPTSNRNPFWIEIRKGRIAIKNF